MAKKATAQDAQVVMQLYDLRREAEMRKARHWWTAEFWPANADDFVKSRMRFPDRKTHGCGRSVDTGIWAHRSCFTEL